MLDFGPARIGQSKQPRSLVIGLANGIIDGGAETHVLADAQHRDDLGVAAGGEEQAVGKRNPVGQPRRQRVRFEMIDGNQRLLDDKRDRLGGG